MKFAECLVRQPNLRSGTTNVPCLLIPGRLVPDMMNARENDANVAEIPLVTGNERIGSVSVSPPEDDVPGDGAPQEDVSCALEIDSSFRWALNDIGCVIIRFPTCRTPSTIDTLAQQPQAATARGRAECQPFSARISARRSDSFWNN